MVSKLALPYLKESAAKGRNPHILNNSPPLSMKPRWFCDHVAYTMAKYGMSMCVLGMAEEFKKVSELHLLLKINNDFDRFYFNLVLITFREDVRKINHILAAATPKLPQKRGV